jgi:hypothetical protein
MRSMYKIIVSLLLGSLIYGCSKEELVKDPEGKTQRFVEHVGIVQKNINVRNETTVGQIAIIAGVSGKAIVRFDGYCVSSPGDRIVLAASNTTSWGVNDGSTSAMALDATINSTSFSHTRVYNIDPGQHTYYAIAHNYVNLAGNGVVSIFGSLTVEFIPSSLILVEHVGINQTNINTRSVAPKIVGQLNITPSAAGKVIANFDGRCVSTYGDRIVLAASNHIDWEVNDGRVSVSAANENVNSTSFSHTRVYDVNAQSSTFYALAHNYVMRFGDGIASVYGSFTGKFVPANSTSTVSHTGISHTYFNMSNKTTVGQITINPTVPGKAVVRFDGEFDSTSGDRIILAASNTTSWGADDGNLTIMSKTRDTHFSHTRVYSVNPGSHTFYALAQNNAYVEPSIYGSLTVEFIPD